MVAIIHVQNRAVPEHDATANYRLAAKTISSGKSNVPASSEKVAPSSDSKAVTVRNGLFVILQGIDNLFEDAARLQDHFTVPNLSPRHVAEIDHDTGARCPVEISMCATPYRNRIVFEYFKVI